MATATPQPNWAGGHVTVYFEMWDGEVSPQKPTVRPHDAWITDPVSITLRIVKPGDDPDEIQTLVDDDIEVVQAGEWRARFLADAEPEDFGDEDAVEYFAIWDGLTADGYNAPAVQRIKVKRRPE